MAGYVLAKFLSCVFMDRDEVVVHENANKKEAILIEQAHKTRPKGSMGYF